MNYQETITRMMPVEQTESIEVPEALVKKVNSRDPVWGANGCNYLGCNRKRQGGHTIDRLQEYVSHHQFYCVGMMRPCSCPINPEGKE